MLFKKLVITITLIQLILFTAVLPASAETAEEWINYGNTFYSQGKYSEAIPYYDAALGIEPNNLRALGCKGNALFVLERYGEAVECYTQVLSIDPTNANAKEYKAKAEAAIAEGKGTTSPDPGSQQSDNLIVSGRVGPFCLGGTTTDQLQAMLGNPSKVSTSKTSSRTVYYYPGLIFYVNGNVVANITVTTYSYQTAEGIRVGSKITNVKKYYEGAEVLMKETTQYNYIKEAVPGAFGVYLGYNGMKFIFDVSQSIVAIEV